MNSGPLQVSIKPARIAAALSRRLPIINNVEKVEVPTSASGFFSSWRLSLKPMNLRKSILE